MSFRPTPQFDFTAAASRSMPVVISPVRLLAPESESGAAPGAKRRRVWELSQYLHCSIVGTCLSSAELRQVLAKAGRDVDVAPNPGPAA